MRLYLTGHHSEHYPTVRLCPSVLSRHYRSYRGNFSPRPEGRTSPTRGRVLRGIHVAMVTQVIEYKCVSISLKYFECVYEYSIMLDIDFESQKIVTEFVSEELKM